MKLRPLLFMALLFCGQLMFAQEKTPLHDQQLTQIVKGTVTDRISGLPLGSVTVRISSAANVKSVSSNDKGEFQLFKVPLGRQTIQASLTGYQQLIISELLVSSGKEAVINMEMEPQNNRLSEVVVSASSNKKPLNQMALTSARSFSPEETNRYAGGFFDPARMAQSFAGVVAGGDDNQIIVRGNSPKSLQWRLEGIEIINPNHFGNEGASGGAISMLNTTVLSTSDFYTGALPAEYSNASAGAFDLKFRKGNTDKREYALTIGVLGAGLAMEGPFKKGSDASYLVSYRYSSLSLLEKAGLSVADQGVPKYQDLSFNIVVPTKKAGTFSLFGIGGLGALNDDAERDYTKWEERIDGQDVNFKFDAGSAGLKHLYIANDNTYFSNILSYSVNRSASMIDTLSNEYLPALREHTQYTNTAIRYAGIINYKLNNTNTIRAGVNASLLSYNLYALGYDTERKSTRQLLDQDGQTSSFDTFLQHKASLNNSMTLNTGIHASYFVLSKTWSVEPRIGLNWQLEHSQTLSFATGIYNRIEPLSYYFAKNEKAPAVGVPPSEKLKPTKSAQAVLGYEKLLGGNLKFKTEVYYQYLYDVPVSADPSINFSLLDVSDNYAILSSSYRSLVNKGSGKNYGLELSLEKSLTNGYYYMLTTSLFDSKFKALSEKEFNTTFNTQYVANLVVGKEWKAGKDGRNLFGLNSKIIYAGGRKYSPLQIEETFRLDEEVIDQSKINTLTADPYFRIDFSGSYRINSKRVNHLLILDIQNLLNKENTLGMHYNPSKRIIEPAKWIGMVPTLNYRLEF
ncbi:TonB-dependent receptor [Pedobacter sp. BAL39]|uniref:TonB-dependent receptor n=1 Tax=Pedobacter sp. BAL39 TaxID=391596 RepID=UPI0012F9403A|nr:TonB-dependent receptor [Pedobacter sp. BAL39]